MQYIQMNKEQLTHEQHSLFNQMEKFCAMGLRLDMSRGKPDTQQLDLSVPLLSITDYISRDGIDARNYGNLEGLPEAREFFAELMGCDPKSVIVGGNSSLNLMYSMIELGWRLGFIDSERPLREYPKVKFLCPSPGYDRHFTITENFGFEMVTVPMTENGPDMDIVEELAANDDTIKGIWCVPQYSNPQGFTYSDETVKRLCAMKTAAPDFMIFWDNAYCVHHLSEDSKEVLPLLSEAQRAGNPHRALMFCSTSKITFAGAGVAAVAACPENLQYLLKQMQPMTISFDKVNQLRHVKFLKNKSGVLEHMKAHSRILKPKFDAVEKSFKQELECCKELVSWTQPKGGYFVNFNAMPGTATRCVELCKQAGVTLTPAGAAFPLGKDKDDICIRIAPTYPPQEELNQALKLFTLSVKLAATEQLLQNFSKLD